LYCLNDCSVFSSFGSATSLTTFSCTEGLLYQILSERDLWGYLFLRSSSISLNFGPTNNSGLKLLITGSRVIDLSAYNKVLIINILYGKFVCHSHLLQSERADHRASPTGFPTAVKTFSTLSTKEGIIKWFPNQSIISSPPPTTFQALSKNPKNSFS